MESNNHKQGVTSKYLILSRYIKEFMYGCLPKLIALPKFKSMTLKIDFKKINRDRANNESDSRLAPVKAKVVSGW